MLIDTGSRCLLLLNQRTGMFQPLDEHDAAGICTDRDKEFLHVLGIRF